MRSLSFLILISGLAISAAGHAASVIDGCQLYPSDNIWNTPVDNAPLDPSSAAYISTIGVGIDLHPDFGTVYNGAPNGIPYITVAGTQPLVPITFQYADESDPGPYPIPPDAPIEGGPTSNGDRHILIVDRDRCLLYEIYAARKQTDGTWRAGSGAKWNLQSNALRPATWTSADAAGLPILPGLVRFDEVTSGEITHALRFTVPQTRRAFVWPARHAASDLNGAQFPPMGQRFRLKAGYDISRFSPRMQVILRALKKYGMMLADNGSAWYLSGAPDPRWDDEELRTLSALTGGDFEAVTVSALQTSADSARAVQALPPPLPPPPADASYDIDGNGQYDALTDGLIVLRWMFGLRGAALISGATGTGATRAPSEIEARLAQLGAALDIDGDNAANALTDGILLMRHLFGLTGAALVNGAIGAGASRASAPAVTTYMQGFILR